MTDTAERSPLAAVELYLLLALAEGASWGYAMMKRIEADSEGAVRPDIGALYRVLARLCEQDLVREAEAPADAEEVHPGRARRYYRMTSAGRAALRSELVRLRAVVELGSRRDLVGRPGRA